MNKIILSIVFLLVASVSAFAGKDVKVKSGDKKVLKQEAVFQCVVELDGATWEEDESFKTHCGNEYEQRVKTLQEFWPKFFAKYSKGPVVSDEAPVYKAVLRLTNFEKSIFYAEVGKKGKIGLEFYGEVEIIEIATGRSVLTLKIESKTGPYDYFENGRCIKTMDALCEDIFDLL